MGRPKSPDPTDGELTLLRVLWTHGASSIGKIQDELAKARPMGYTTIQSNLQKMIDKGYIQRDERRGRIVTYTALIDENDTRQRLIKRLADKLFGGSIQKLVNYAVSGKKLTEDELASLKKKVDESDSSRA